MTPTEPDNIRRLRDHLREHGDVLREVEGVHVPTGRKVRIDLLWRPFDAPPYFEQVGIEVKAGTLCTPQLVAQCVDYANSDFHNVGRVPVFCFPGIMRRNMNNAARAVLSLATQLGVGSVHDAGRFHGGLSLYWSLNRVWSPSMGWTEPAKKMARARVGSRSKQDRYYFKQAYAEGSSAREKVNNDGENG